MTRRPSSMETGLERLRLIGAPHATSYRLQAAGATGA